MDQITSKCGPCFFPILTDGTLELVGKSETSLVELTSIDLGQLCVAKTLRDFCKRHDIKVSSLFSATWALVLSRYLDLDTVAFGTLIAGQVDAHQGICIFERNEEDKVADVLRNVESSIQTTCDTFAASSGNILPLIKDGSVKRLFNSAVISSVLGGAQQVVVPETVRLAEHGFDDVEAYVLQQSNSIHICVTEAQYHVEANFAYDPALVTKPQVENIAVTFAHVLAQVVEFPTLSLKDMTYVSDTHLQKILSWNAHYPPTVEACAQDLIAKQVRLQPEAEAVCSWDGNLTYGELDSYANALAHHLINFGVGPDVIVPICFEKSRWAKVAILAVVKAGGAIVSIDPKQPEARSSGIMDEVRATMVLTSSKTASLWESKRKVFVVDEVNLAALPSQSESPTSRATPDNILYLIFTSGSTGKPKGCVVQHKSFLTASIQHRTTSKINETTRLLQITSYSFDVSMLEIFTSLIAGACICVPGDEDLAQGIANVINQYQITWTFMTPSVVRVIEPKTVPTLKTLALGGEALSATDVRTWAAKLQLVNGYGPTECSVAATINESLTVNTDPANIGIGRGALCWVVDANDHNKLVPIGAVGELLIHGPIVAKGYFNNVEKTEEVFINDPAFLSSSPFANRNQLYKTGDLVRNNSDGTINFIGRKDNQVKLRGQRLELGEIEHNLSVDADIRHAMVLLPRKGFCKENLVAVITLKDLESQSSDLATISLVRTEAADDQSRMTKDIQDRLCKKLPAYMVPTIWVVLHSIPRNISGKLNRVQMTQWLVDMDESTYNFVAAVETQTELVEPVTGNEKLLQTIWSAVLDLDTSHIGSNRSFLSLGGDSVKGMQVVAKCRAAGFRMTVQDVIQTKSLASLAASLKSSAAGVDASSTTSLKQRLAPMAEYDLSKIFATSKDEVEDVFTCTPMQEGILLSQVKDISTYALRQLFYASSLGTSPLSLDRLENAWQKLVNRHGTLRTVFVDDYAEDSQFHQMQLRLVKASVSIIQSKGAKEEVLEIMRRQEPARYARGRPNHHLTLCETSDGFIACMLEINHALIDGGSTEVIMRDFAMAYDGVLSAVPGPSYGKYIEYIQSQSESTSLEYWKKYLADPQPCLLPMFDGDKQSPHTPRLKTVDIEHGQQLQAFCKQNELTIANFMTTAWGLLLRTYTGADDVCFGFVASGRDVPVDGIEDMVGACINMTVSRLRITEDIRVVELAKRAQDSYFESLPHQHTSLAKIQNTLNVSGLTLFNTILSLQREVPENATNGENISFHAASDDDPIDFDLAISINVADDKIQFILGYWSNNVSETEAENIASVFSSVIKTMMQNSTAIARDLNFYSDRDEKIALALNAAATSCVEASVTEHINKQIQRKPDELALASWDGDFTYEQMDRITTKLAYFFKSLGVKPNVFVPYYFDKSVWATLSAIAVLKAGGAFVGLSTSSPIDRLKVIIEECRAPLVLTSRKQKHIFDGLSCLIVVIDQVAVERLTDVPPEAIFPLPASSHAAYVSFTSGSTGKPKGIVVEHGALLSSIMAHGTPFGWRSDSRVFQFASYAFDAAVAEVYTTLVYGGCVCIPSEQERMTDLAGSMNRLDVTLSFMTPRVAATISPKQVPSLKTLLVGGEAVSMEDVRQWTTAVDLLIVYGPTETSIFALGTKPLSLDSDPLNLGYARGWNRLWIVDQNNSDILVPTGTIGELVIEGRSVARCYINEHEKTTAVFKNDFPWMKSQMLSGDRQRLYMSGDLVRFEADGSLKYYGRKDNQVKIRGQRVELGEIEHAIVNNLEALELVVVDCIEFPNTGKAIVAFIQMNTSSLSTEDWQFLPIGNSLRAKLSSLETTLTKCLASYMVPSLFFPTSRIPMMSISGKVDRKQLRAAVLQISAADLSTYRLSSVVKKAPVKKDELVLRDMWAELLGRDPSTIGVDDSFFRLGGDSILSMKLVSVVRAGGYTISVADIFQHGDLGEMATKMTPLDADAMKSSLVSLEPFSMLSKAQNTLEFKSKLAQACGLPADQLQDIYPCSPLQEGMMSISTRQEGSYVTRNAYHVPLGMDIQKFKIAWQTVVDTFSILRTRVVQSGDGQSFQIVVKPQPLAFRTSSGVDQYLVQDKATPIGYGDALLRLALIKNKSGDQYDFVFTAHHAIYDGWTLQGLFQELSKVYRSVSTAAIPEIPYRQFIEYLNVVDKRAEAEFWKSHLAGNAGASFPRLPSATYQPRTDSFLSYRMTGINRMAGTGITMPTVLRAAWALVLARYTDDADTIIYGQVLSGRNAPINGIDKILGPTITTVPFRLDVDRRTTVGKFLEYVQHQATGMIPFEHTGLLEIRRITGAAGANADFKNLFVIHAAAHAAENIDLLGLEDIPLESNTFDTYAITMEVSIQEDALKFDVTFDSTVISEERIKFMTRHLEQVIRQINTDSDVLLADVTLFSKTDNLQLAKWHRKNIEFESDCIHHVFRQQLLLHPDQMAIEAWDGKVTYREFDELTTQLAYHLSTKYRIQPETLVPICFDKSLWTVVSQYAVLKAGGGCVMLNPEHPPSRLLSIMSNTNSKVALIAPHYKEMFASMQVPALAVDSKLVRNLPDCPADAMMSVNVQPHNAAVVVFTSGSTGAPKGIVIEHRMLCSVSVQHGPELGFRQGMRVLQFCHLTFDVSNAEIFLTLMHGGTICIADETERLNNLEGCLNDFQVDWMFLTPSVAELLDPKDVPLLRTLVLGGEASNKALLEKFTRHLKIINSYGPAECTIWASHSVYGPDVAASNIGRSKACHIWIAEAADHNKLTPMGCVGEILIEGPNVARGYLNEPEKTAAVFIENPPWLPKTKNADRRLYKSGDLGSYRADGSIMIAGRADTQVKFHGQRLELGEIEHHIQVQSEVEIAMATLPKNGPCKGHLVVLLAFKEFAPVCGPNQQIIVIGNNHKKQAQKLVMKARNTLADSVPPYMVPAIWLVIKDVPFTPSGKINRNVLKTWLDDMPPSIYAENVFGDVVGDIVLPATEMEVIIHGVCCSVLGKSKDETSMALSFTGLGGDSITAMQFVSRCRSDGIELSVKSILQSKSLSALASQAKKTSGPAIQKAEAFDKPFALSPIQQLYFDRNMGTSDSEPSQHHFNQSVLLKFNTAMETDVVVNAASSIVSRHSMLRAYFSQLENGKWMQLVGADTFGRYHFASHDVASKEEMLRISGEQHADMDIEKVSLFKVDLFTFADGQQFLSLIAHHLIVDFVSWTIILRDMERLLQKQSLSSEKPLPFQVWNDMQAKQALTLDASTVLPFEIPPSNFAYWNLPQNLNTYRDLVSKSFALDAKMTSMLVADANRALRTETLDVLLASLIQSFSKTFQDRDVPAIYLESHGRESWDSSIDPSETVGWFTSIYPVHAPCTSNSEFMDVVRHVKDTRRAVPDNGRPYFALQHFSPSSYQSQDNQDVEITLNYFGQNPQLGGSDGIISQEKIEEKANLGSTVRSLTMFDVSAIIIDGCLEVSMNFNKNVARQAQISSWIEEFQTTITQGIMSLISSPIQFTLSDFPLIKTSYASIAELMTATLPKIGIATSNVEDIFPCSPMQEGILLSQARQPGTYEVHQISEIIRPQGMKPLDINRLRDAWQTVVNYHSLLRTIFLQNISSQSTFTHLVLKKYVANVVLLQHDGDDVLEILKEYPRVNYTEPQPPHRVIFCKNNDRLIMRLDISHSLIDGTSMAIMMSDFVKAYEAGLPQETGPSYVDYITYLSRQSTGSTSPGLDYWKSYLTGVEPCIFPSLLEVADTKTADLHKELVVMLGSESVLSKFCQKFEVSMANLFQAAWLLVLRAYTGSDETSFGYMTAGRDIPVNDIYNAVGPFINILVCRQDLALKTGAMLVRQLKDDYLNSLQYQHISLATVQNSLGISGTALFNTSMSLQRLRPEEGIPPLDFKVMDQSDPSEHEVALQIATGREEVELTLTYITNKMTEDQAFNIANAFKSAIRALTEDPEKLVTDLNLFSEHDSQAIVDWNGSAPPDASESCIHWLIEKQVKARPNAQAVVSWDDAFTYSELDELTSRLARHLCDLGVGPEVTVPLCFPKSAWTVFSMIAIIKAGGCTVTTNPKDPVSRLESIIADTNSVVTLSSGEFAPLLTGTGLKNLIIDRAFVERLPRAPGFSHKQVKPSNRCVVMFTSGSTGKPKGVMVEHRSLATVATQHAPQVKLGPEARVLNYSAYTWDVSTAENLYTLVNGGCVCVPSDFERMNDIPGSIKRMNVNWAFFTPTVAALLNPAELPSLKTLLLGGEKIPSSEVPRWKHLDLFNSYGPAECAVWTSNVKHTMVGGEVASASIGHPVGCRLWITDANDPGRLVPVGAVGELLIEGPIVTRGYLNNPQVTAKAYIEAAPAWMTELQVELAPSTRLYRTGDLVRYNPSGTINILGRADSQIKFNGQRMELSEIEAQIRNAYKGSSQLAVDAIAPVARNGKKSLAAFFYCGDGSSTSTSAMPLSVELRKGLGKLQADLNKIMPFFMVPTAFIPVSHWPVTTSMKVDRKILRQLGTNFSEEQLSLYALTNSAAKRAVSTENEKVLQGLWGKVLGITNVAKAIGADDDFFRLGGDSVIAMKLVAEARAVAITLKVADVFQHPVLSDMAKATDVAAHDLFIDSDVEPYELVGGEAEATRLIDLASEQCKVVREAVQDIYPCSPLQEALMAIASIQTTSYVLQNVLKLPASLDIERFKFAWQTLVDRHSIFRTRIIRTSKGALQVVLKQKITWLLGDSVEEYIERDKTLPVEYGGELVRYAIVGAQNNLHFIWTGHHAVYDGWTVPMILDQVTSFYEGKSGREEVPYSRFINYLSKVDQQSSDAFWKSQFSGEAVSYPLISSAAYKPQPCEHIHHFVTVDRASDSSITMATIVRAAWALLLSRHSDTDAVSFGLTLSGRNAPVSGIENIMGPTITTVPVEITINAGGTVLQYLEDVQAQSTAMIQREHTGLQNIKRISSEARAAVDFRNLLVIQIGHGDDEVEEELPLGIVQVPQPKEETESYPLTAECTLKQKGLQVELQYDTAIIEPGLAVILLHQFEKTIHQLAAASQGVLVKDVSLVSTHDLQLLDQWNSEAPTQVSATLHSMVEMQVVRQPQRPAVNGHDGNLTYAELDALANKLALHLVTNGVTAGVKVPLCFPKSTWTIVALLAIMKCGGTCVMMNPEHPIERLKLLFTDIDASLLVCHSSFLDKFQSHIPCVVSVDAAFLSDLPHKKADTSLPSVHPSSPAFVVYTSGSTGLPKGIVIEHQQMCTSLLAHSGPMAIDSQSRVAQFSAYTFDVSIEEIFSTLMVGGCVCVMSDHDRMNNLAGAIRDLRINWMDLTPTVANMLDPADVPEVKHLALGGEALTKEVIDRWASVATIKNSYGPAECCVACVTQVNVTPQTDASNIGRAIGCLAWVVDPTNPDHLSPLGTPGELLIEGPIVSRGYLNDPEKTVKAFVTNLAWAKTENGVERRFYRTGDLVKYNADGTIGYIGRRDTQVKLHGQRIEMGEIEYQLKNTHPRILQVAVEVVAPKANQKILAAFVQLDDQSVASNGSVHLPMTAELLGIFSEIRESLKSRLPTYMIPSIFIPISDMPKSASAKTDRKALRSLPNILSEEELSSYYLNIDKVNAAPTTEDELLLQKLWSETLGLRLSSIGADSSFFRLGGDSVSAMHLVAAVRAHKMTLTVAQIFETVTLSSMAVCIRANAAQKEISRTVRPFSLVKESSLAAITDEAVLQCQVLVADIEDIYPSTPLQEGMIALSARQEDAYTARNVFRLPATLSLSRLQAAWQRLVDGHPILRTRIITTTCGTLQVVLREEIVWEKFASVNAYNEHASAEPMGYGKPLTRFGIIEETSDGKKTSYLTWTVHHAVYDGWSESMLFDQLQKCYQDDHVPAGIPYSHFIDYLTNDLDQATADRFWREQMSGVASSDFLRFPTPQYRPQVDSTVSRSIKLARKGSAEVTLSTLLRAAWAIVHARHAGSEDVVFGVTLSGRNAPVSGIASMMGPTISTVPVRFRLEDMATLTGTQYLQQAQTLATAMMPFEHTGLQHIQKLGPEGQDFCDLRCLFIYQPSIGSDDGVLGLERIETDMSGFETFPLLVQCGANSDGTIELELRHDSNIVSKDQAAWMTQHFEICLQALNDKPQTLLSQLDMVGPGDIEQLKEWNSKIPTAIDSCLHQLVKKQVAKRGSDTAIHSWDGELTYAQLDGLSDRLASALISKGVTSGTIVPLCFDKSAWAVVSMLAVLKAGGACRSMDPQHPSSRQEDIIRESKAKLVMVSAAYANTFKFPSIETMVVKPEAIPSKRLTTVAASKPTDLAFVVTTSGSTGVPKGVAITHRAMASSMIAHGPALHFKAGQRVLQFAAYTFDISIAEMFTTLIHGGCICIPSDHDRMNDLGSTMATMGVEWACLTSTVAKLVTPAQIPSLKTLVLSGEAPSQTNLDTWGGHVRLLNAYGPSECSVWSSCLDNLQKTTSPTNIGYGIGSRLWITEPGNEERITPIGCIGELLIEGPILANGYLEKPDKTAEAFVKQPTWLSKFGPISQSGALYKTGDFVRYNMDGSMEYLGRKDGQKKINGQRIELGEIEFNLKKILTGAREMAVDIVSPQYYNGKNTLTAFICMENADNSAGGNAEVLQEINSETAALFAKTKANLLDVLPKHMVPSLMIPVKRLPTIPSGKLDRKVLGQIGRELSMEQLLAYSLANVSKRMPVTEDEKKLASLWSEALGVDSSNIGLDGNFFQLGGDSIVAMRLVSLARKQFPAINVTTIFRFPRLEEAAKALSASTADKSVDDRVMQRDKFTQIHVPDVNKFLESVVGPKANTSRDNIYDVLKVSDLQALAITGGRTETRWMLNYFYFDSHGAGDLARLQVACLAVVQHFDALRTVYIRHKSEFLQVILKTLTNNVSIIETADDINNFTEDIYTSGRSKHIPLEEPLAQFYIIKETHGTRHRVVLRISHAQYDGVSLPHIWSCLKAAFDGQPLEPCTDFSSYMYRSVERRNSESMDYWKSLLSGSQMTDIVLRNKPNLRRMGDEVQTLSQTLNIKALRLNNITFATVMKAAWALVLSQLSASSDVVFGHTISGRNLDVDGVESVVGACINVIPVRVPFQPGWTVIDLLEFIQEQQLSNVAYETMGTRDIIKNCTNWPSYKYFSSIIQHQNIDDGGEAIEVGGNTYTAGFHGSDLDLVDMAILSTPRGDEVDVTLTFDCTSISPDFGKKILALLCKIVKSFFAKPTELLPPPMARKPIIPFSAMKQSSSGKSKTIVQVSEVEIVDEEVQARLLPVLERLWVEILGGVSPTAVEAAVKASQEQSFFELGADIVQVALLQCALEEEGYKTKIEDLVVNDTISKQITLLGA